MRLYVDFPMLLQLLFSDTYYAFCEHMLVNSQLNSEWRIL